MDNTVLENVWYKPAVFAVNGVLYAAGGYDEDRQTYASAVFSLDTTNETAMWEKVYPSMRWQMSQMKSVIVHGDTAFLTGGFGPYIDDEGIKRGPKVSSQLWSWRPGDQQWKILPEFTDARMAHCSVTDGVNLIWVTGGKIKNSNSDKQLSSVEEYDISKKVWRKRAPLPIPLAYHQCLYMNKMIIVTGGQTDGENVYSDNIYIYTPETDVWSTSNEGLLEPLVGHMMFYVP